MIMDKESIEYAEKLSVSLRELVIEKGELAELLHKSGKTITRYLKQENVIKKSDREKIDCLIKERSEYYEFKHIPSEEFKGIVDDLLKEFKDEITQKGFAKLVGFSNQSQVSKSTTGEKILSTKEQYDVLSAFLRLCTNQNAYDFRGFDAANVFTKHYDTAKRLYRMLHGNTVSFERFEKYEDLEFSNFVVKLRLINYFVTLPYQAHVLMLDNPSAFFDSLQILYFDRFIECERVGGNALYPSVSEFIDRFNELPRRKRIVFQNVLEQMCAEKRVFSYYDYRDNWQLFDIVTQYRRMIRSARDRRIADTTDTLDHFGKRIDGYEPICDYNIDYLKDKDKDNSIDEEKQRRLFEEIIYDLIDFDRTQYTIDELTDHIIDDIEKRLTMCPYEWYIWMLYASYVFAYQEDDSIYELMQDVDNGAYDDLADQMIF